jgi:hypothetical protein
VDRLCGVRCEREVRLLASLLLALSTVPLATACQPKVQVEAPKEPITINLNVKIEHEIRVKVDRDLEELFEEEEGLF